MAEFLDKDGGCCGVVELEGIGGARSPKDKLISAMQGNGGAFGVLVKGRPFVFFTGATRGTGKVKYAEDFKKFITENNLGVVNVTKPGKNSSSGNHVTMYVWGVDQKALSAWWDKNDPDNQTDDDDEEGDGPLW